MSTSLKTRNTVLDPKAYVAPKLDATFSPNLPLDYNPADAYDTELAQPTSIEAMYEEANYIVSDRIPGGVDTLPEFNSDENVLGDAVAEYRDSLQGGECGVWGAAMKNIFEMFLEAHVLDVQSRVTSEQVSEGWFRDRARGAQFASLGIYVEGLNCFPGDSEAIGSVLGIKNGFTLAREARAAKARARREAAEAKAKARAAAQAAAREAARQKAMEDAAAKAKAKAIAERRARKAEARKAEAAAARKAAAAEARKAAAAEARKVEAIAARRAKAAAAPAAPAAAPAAKPNRRRRGGSGQGSAQATSTRTSKANKATGTPEAKKATRRGGRRRSANRGITPAAVSAS